MKMFRSLLYREISVAKKGYIMFAVFALGSVVFFLAALTVMLADTPQGDPAAKFVIDLSILVAACAGGSLSSDTLEKDNITKPDITSGWLIYSYALPISPKMRAAVKISRRQIFAAAGLIFSISAAMIYSVLFGF